MNEQNGNSVIVTILMMPVVVGILMIALSVFGVGSNLINRVKIESPKQSEQVDEVDRYKASENSTTEKHSNFQYIKVKN